MDYENAKARVRELYFCLNKEEDWPGCYAAFRAQLRAFYAYCLEHRGELPPEADYEILEIAARHADQDAMESLLGSFDPAARNSRGQNVLAVLAGYNPAHTDYRFAKGMMYKMCSRLLEHSPGLAKEPLPDSKGFCYHEAARYCNGELIQALYDHGANISGSDARGNNGLHLLCQEGLGSLAMDVKSQQSRLEMQERYKDGASDHDRDYYARVCKIFEDIQEYYALPAAEAFLAAGLDPEDINDMQESACVLADRLGPNKISALFRAGTTAPGEVRVGGLSLHQAVLGDHSELITQIARQITEAGGDLNALAPLYKGQSEEATAFALACNNFNIKAMKLLLELGADPAIPGSDGRTGPALFFSRNGYDIHREDIDELFTLLQKSSFDINAPGDDAGNTLLVMACYNEQTAWVLDEKDYGIIGDETLQRLLVSALVKNGADVNNCGNEGLTPLMALCRHGYEQARDIAELLLSKGARLDLKDVNGDTALHYCAANERQRTGKELAELLFRHGDPLPAAVNNAGQTALDSAVATRNEALAKMLVKKM